MPARAVRFTVGPIRGARFIPVVRPLSLNIYKPGILATPSLTLPTGTALPPSISKPVLQLENSGSPAVSPTFLSPDSLLPAIWNKEIPFATSIEDYFDREHWSPELIADDHYGEILEEGISLLSHEDVLGKPKILQNMREKDGKTYSHMMRVGIISGMLALLMGMPQDEARIITWAARLHDVGKFEDDIQTVINKKGKLDAKERQLINAHSYRGWALLDKQEDIPLEINDLAKVVAIQHHERMIQVGYPYGVQGPDLSLASRITAAADYLDALLENRPYRSGLTIERAHEMMEEVGDQFDPDVRDAIWRLLQPSVLN